MVESASQAIVEILDQKSSKELDESQYPSRLNNYLKFLDDHSLLDQ